MSSSPYLVAVRLAFLSALAWGAAVLPLAPLFAQSNPRRLFVDATDATGGPVLGLQPGDFEVRESGEQRQISRVTMVRRPTRIVLMIDSTEAIRQPIGQIRNALVMFLQALDPQHEMMFLTVAGTPQVRVRPTLERQQMVNAAEGLFGTPGANVMHRLIDDAFHRFALTTHHRPLFVVMTTEGFESTDRINPQEIKHLVDHFRAMGGRLHAVRLLVTNVGQTFRGGNLTEMPVTLMVGRDTGGTYTNISPNGLAQVLEGLATTINEWHTSQLESYHLEYSSQPAKGKKPGTPDVRVTREGVKLSATSAP
jgi:hypothetical protein